MSNDSQKTNKKCKINRFVKHGFRFYFILLVTIIVFVTVLISVFASDAISQKANFQNRFITFAILTAFCVIVAWILSVVVSFFIIKPIKILMQKMNQVTKGNLQVHIQEENYIKEIENINQSFNIMMKELRANQEMQKDFMSNVSHEFKTPLSAIEGYATLLQDKTLTDEEKDEYIKEILSTTTLMSDLVRNVLLLSKIENQALEYNKNKFYIDEQIRKVVVMLEPNWSQKKLQIDADFEKVQVYSNQSLLNHVWHNLIENAIKFSPKNGKITIKLIKQNNSVIFEVSDEGPGIKEHDINLIFDKFYQADSSRRQEGNGLGLSLVKKIVDIMDGEVKVENLKKGCKFTVTLNNILYK